LELADHGPSSQEDGDLAAAIGGVGGTIWRGDASHWAQDLRMTHD
jgi:hypothetical protein